MLPADFPDDVDVLARLDLDLDRLGGANPFL
jgi:hypothetical protein